MVINPPEWTKPITAFVTAHPVLTAVLVTAAVALPFGYWLGS